MASSNRVPPPNTHTFAYADCQPCTAGYAPARCCTVLLVLPGRCTLLLVLLSQHALLSCIACSQHAQHATSSAATPRLFPQDIHCSDFLCLLPHLHAMPMAPCATAGSISSISMICVMCWVMSRRFRPARASNVALQSPSCSLRRRVCTFPRKLTTWQYRHKQNSRVTWLF